MNEGKGKSLQTLLVLLIFGVFGLSAMLLTLLGANAYRGVTDRMEGNNALRSSLSYVANKIRAGDEKGAISLMDRDGTSVLCLTETVEGDGYLTCIYYYDGWVREFATVAENRSFDLGNGEKVTALAGFQIGLEGNLVQLSASSKDGDEGTLQVALRS